MLAATHMLGGAAAAALAAQLAGRPPAAALAAAALGALLPDLDSRHSKGSRLLGPVAAVLVAYATWPAGWSRSEVAAIVAVLAAGTALPAVLARTLGHRHALHSLVVHLVVAAAALVLAWAQRGPAWVHAAIGFAALGSVVGGLALDACTIRGIPLWWPWRPENVHLLPLRWRVRTGQQRERSVRFALALLVVALLVVPRWASRRASGHALGRVSMNAFTAPRLLAMVGSRSFAELHLVHAYVLRLHPGCVVISGGVPGADQAAAAAARRRGLEVVIVAADAEADARRAGVVRTRRVVEACQDLVAFWDGICPRTRNALAHARRLQRPHEIVFNTGSRLAPIVLELRR